MFTFEQTFHAPIYVDQFFHNATIHSGKDKNGKKFHYVRSKIDGIPFDFDYEDLGSILGLDVDRESPYGLDDSAVLDDLAMKLVDSTDVTNIFRKHFDELMYQISHLVGQSLFCKTGNHGNFNVQQWEISAAIYLVQAHCNGTRSFTPDLWPAINSIPL